MIEEEFPKKTESGNYKYPEADESERPASAEVEQPVVDIHSACLDKAKTQISVDKLKDTFHEMYHDKKTDFVIEQFEKELGL